MSIAPNTNGTTVATEAQRLCKRGFAIVPCNGKKATLKEWQSKILSRQELLSTLRESGLNIAIELSQSNLIDVECDSPEAETALVEMFGGEIPDTPTWKSKRGKHRLFRRPSDLPPRAVIELEGVEFRIGNGKGALSLVPPSVHPDGPKYEWVRGLSVYDVDPAELPESITMRLRATRTSQSEPEGGRITEGKRNKTLFAKACDLRALNLPSETILTTLKDLNERLCDPPLPITEVESIVTSAMSNEANGKDVFVARLLREIELWHDEAGEPYVTLRQDDHLETWKIGNRSKQFRRWLSKRYYDSTGVMLNANVLADVASLLEGKAVFDGPAHKVFIRTAEVDGKLYLDLCDAKWRAVEIDDDGWRVVTEPPVKFRRAKAMLNLPEPTLPNKGESLWSLLSPVLNVTEKQWPLLAAHITASLRPRGPYPTLKLFGEQGSAKSTQARVIRAIIDPNAAPVRAEPHDTRDLMVAANNGWVLCFDNLSTIRPDLSDALCRLATGGGFATRALYTDDDETIFDAMRPVIVTSIEEIGTRSDLLERSLLIEVPRIETRRTEKAIWKEFESAHPRILGALLNVVSSALKRLPEVESEDADLSRMADFEQWGTAVEMALGLDAGTFKAAYAKNRDSATQTALESSPVVTALLKRMEKPTTSLETTAADLLKDLAARYPEYVKDSGWPKNARVLSAILRRVRPNLRSIGIIAEPGTKGAGNAKVKVWRIKHAPTTEAQERPMKKKSNKPKGR